MLAIRQLRLVAQGQVSEDRLSAMVRIGDVGRVVSGDGRISADWERDRTERKWGGVVRGGLALARRGGGGRIEVHPFSPTHDPVVALSFLK